MAPLGIALVPTILLADEDPEFRELITFALRREGFHVITTADGPQTLARWQSDQPDLVLLGAHLPGLDGFDVCQRIRQASATPIIVVTAKASEFAALQAFQV